MLQERKVLQQKEGAAGSGSAAGKEVVQQGGGSGKEVLQEVLQEGKVLQEEKRCGKGGPAGREEGLQEGTVLRELLDEVCVLQAINKLPTKAAAQHCLRFDLRGREVRKFSTFT